MTGTRRTIATWIVAGGVAVAVLYALFGRHDAIAPGTAPEPPSLPAPARIAVAERAATPIFEDAVGTVRSLRQVTVAAQVTARVVSVQARVGDRVTAGAPLVLLDDGDFVARFTRARAQYERVKGFLAKQAATAEQMETAGAEFQQAKTAMEHTRITAPVDGIVAERQVEPGDLAVPGRPLLAVLDPTALRLEARVREGSIARIQPGAKLSVSIPAANIAVEGTVAEVLPSADPRSRTFEVRVNFGARPDVHPGMFGRLRLPVGERDVVRVPAAAVERVGQLETVVVRDETGWRRRLVTTGAPLADDAVEILSGLHGGETVGLPPA